MSYPATERIPGVPISLGESINVPVSSLKKFAPGMRRHGRSSSTSESVGVGSSSKSRLPPAVATVPAEHIRGYVHTKIIGNNYLVGRTLGEGSFAKVKEAFHLLVGEKASCTILEGGGAQMLLAAS